MKGRIAAPAFGLVHRRWRRIGRPAGIDGGGSRRRWPPLKKASAANGATAGPPELIWNAGVLLPGVTTSVTVAVCVRLPPPVPVMVRVELPVGVVPAVEMVKKMQCGETAWSSRIAMWPGAPS